MHTTTANTNLAYGGYARLTDLSAVGGMTGEATRILLQDVEKRERKRQQNRIAQRNYRRNQKQRIQALEAALGQLEPLDPSCTLASPATSHTDTKFDLSTSPNTSPTFATQLPPNPTQNQNPNQNQNPSPCDSQHLWPLDTTTWKRPHQPIPITPIPTPPAPTDMLPTTTTNTNPNPEPRNALHLAIHRGNESIVRLLLDRGADVSKQDHHTGSTALHLAAERGSDVMTGLLLEKGADVEERDFLGRTALIRAVAATSGSNNNGGGIGPGKGSEGGNGGNSEGKEKVVRLLLEASADVNAKDSLGNMALHLAVESGSEPLVLLLLQYGADVDA